MEIFRLFGRIMIDNDQANQSIQNTGEQAEKSGGKLDKLGAFAKSAGAMIGGALLAGVTAAATGLVALGNVASDMQNALGNLQAKTGASDDEMKNLESTLSNIYASGYGESFDEIADAMATVMQNTSASGAELERITKIALGLSETFDFDVVESTRAAEQMSKQFGITSEQAFNLMVQGAQQGANKNNDMIDVLNEYSPIFSSIGLDAEYMMDILISGAENGAFSIDKLADGVKEFNIRMKDGNDATKQALTDLGFNADEMANAFARGGEEGANAFNEIMTGLAVVEDPLLKNQLGVALMGTAFEDLESTAVASLAETMTYVDMNADSLSKLNEIKYDTLGEALKGIGRSALMGIVQPFNEHVMPIINSFASQIAEQMPNVQSTMSNLFGTIIDGARVVFNFFQENIIPIFTTVYDYLSANVIPIFQQLFEWVQRHLPTIQATFQTVFDKVKLVIGYVWSIIQENLLPIFTRLFGWVSEKIPVLQSIWENSFGIIKNVISAVWDIIENFLMPVIKGLVDFISLFLPPIQAIVEGVFDGIFWAVDKVVGIFEAVSSAISTAIDWLTFWNDSEVEDKDVNVNTNYTSSNSNDFPQYAVGTNYHRGGLAIVGEKGPEILELPVGSKIKTANQTNELLGKKNEFNNTYNIYTTDDPSKVVAKEMRKLAFQFN